MKNFKKFLFLCAVCISAAMSLAFPAFAEGSRDLIETPYGKHENMEAYRPYLEWRDREQLGGIPSKNVIYVYAKAGEKVYFGSSVKSANDKSIKAVVGDNASQEIDSNLQGSTIAVTLPTDDKEGVYDPTGKADAVFVDGSTIKDGTYDSKKVYLFKPDLSTQQGLIVNLEQEKNGPRGVNDSSVDPNKGYKPMSFVAPVTGTYSFRFLSTEYAETDIPDSSVDFTYGTTLDINFDSLTVSDEDKDNFNFTVNNDDINIKVDVNGAYDGRARYFYVKANDTNRHTSYSKYLDATATGEPANIQFTPPKQPSKVEVLWSFDETTNTGTSSIRLHIDQGGTELTHQDHSVDEGISNREYITSVDITDTINPIKIYASGYPINIYAIKYTYLDDTTTPPSTGGDPVTYTFENGMPEGLELIDDNEPDIINDLNNITNNTANYTHSAKFNEVKNYNSDGTPEHRAIKYTPDSNGTITVDVYTNKNGGNIYITQNPQGKDTEATAQFTSDNSIHNFGPISVESGKPVYIYSDTTAFYCGITFTPASSGSSDLAQEDPLTGNEEQLARKINEKWVNSPSIVSAWDVTVADKDGKVQNGRAWSDVLALNAGNHQRSIYSNFYILTKDGFEYQFNSNGMQPYGFAFYANNRGFLLDRFNQYTDYDIPHNLQSFAHSFYSFGESDSVGAAPQYMEMDSNGNPVIIDGKVYNTSVLPNYTPTDTEKDHNHKIFFNEVESNNPVLTAYTTSGKLADNDSITQKSTELNITPTYTGLGVQADVVAGINYGTKGVGGYFTFEVSNEQLSKVQGSSYNITLDFSGYELDDNDEPVLNYDGTWQTRTGDMEDNEKNNIVVLSTFINKAGNYTITWDGKDNYGNDVPEGKYGGTDSGVVSSYLELGTVHFPIADVERAPQGIKVKMLNEEIIGLDEHMGKDFVYYNNDGTAQTTPEYFIGRDEGNYPSKIADGLNATSGISTNFDNPKVLGALIMVDYDEYDSKNAGNISEAQKAYGNYCAIDLASRYATKIEGSLIIGVHDSSKAESLAAVSFVAANDSTKFTDDNTFDKSHILDMEAVRPEKKYKDATGLDTIYGNTISTGFIADIVPGNKTFNWVEWVITIPVSEKATAAYVKIPAGIDQDSGNYIDEMQISLMELFGEEAFDQDVSLSIDGDIEDLGSDPNAPQEETDIYTSVSLYDSNNTEITDLNSMIQAAPVLEDGNGVQVNKGSIYKVQSTESNPFSKLVIKLKYQISSVTGGTTATHGLIIDNFYAPGASAVATFSTENNSDVQEVTNGNGNVIDADNLNEYNNSDYNEYNNVNNNVN